MWRWRKDMAPGILVGSELGFPRGFENESLWGGKKTRSILLKYIDKMQSAR